MKDNRKQNNIVSLVAVFLVALGARLLKLILDPLLMRDSALYLFLAEIWEESGDYGEVISSGTITPPLPLFLIVKLMKLGFSAEIVGRSIALFLGAMVPVLGYLIAHQLFYNKLVTALATILLIFHPTLISYSIQPLRENYYLFFGGLTFLQIVNGVKRWELKDWGLCGVFLASAVNCRYEALELLFFCPLIVCLFYIRRMISRKRLILSLSMFFASSIVTCFLLLSITNYDISFISKLSKYSDRYIQLNNVRNFIQDNPQSIE